jgi:hypothetical protein
MADNPTQVPPSTGDHALPLNVSAQQQGILDQTLGEVLKSNPQAQGMVMQAMHLSPEKFQQLLTMTNNNAMMNTKIRDLFSSGVVQQAMAQQGQNAQQLQVDPSQIQITPEQAAQIQAQGGENVIVQPAPQQQTSFVQKLKGWLGL